MALDQGSENLQAESINEPRRNPTNSVHVTEEMKRDSSISIKVKDSTPVFKRVFFRLRSQGSDLSEIEISDKFCAQEGLPPLRRFDTPHYVHGGDYGDEKIYHITLDINHAEAPPDIKIQDIPHEMYRVHFKHSRIDPTFERLHGQWLVGARSFSNGFWWGRQNVGLAP